MTEPQESADDDVWKALALTGKDIAEGDRDRFFELYKLMVASSEALVGRRQGVNTFFLTANGALLTGIGLVLKSGGEPRLVAGGVALLSVAGGLLSWAWHSLLISFGQLNTGKFAVINRMESALPAAIYAAEWKALGEGKDPKIYRSFTSREVWAPLATTGVYVITVLLSLAVFVGLWKPSLH
jgi:hypothetical protein